MISHLPSFITSLPHRGATSHFCPTPPSCPVKRNTLFPIRPNPTIYAKGHDSELSSPAATRTTFTWAIGQSRSVTTLESVTEAITRAAPTLSRRGLAATLVFLLVRSTFGTSPHDDLRRVVSVAKKALAMRRVLTENTLIYGCTTSHYVSEYDHPSVTVVLVHFPEGTAISTFHIENENTFDLDWKQNQWYDFVGIPTSTPESTEPQLNIMLLQHPDFDAMEDLLSGLDFAYPGIRKLGASASRSNPMHDIYLFDISGPIKSGVLGLAFASSDVQIDVTVSQGARGVGPLLEVLEICNGNEITRVKEVNTPGSTEAPPMVLLDMWGKTDYISQEDREHARKYLLFGVEVQNVVDLAVASMSKESTSEQENVPAAQRPIHMVIRKVVGFNEATKSLHIEGEDVRLGSRVQFQIRDEDAARAELTSLFNRLTLEGSSKAMEGMTLMGGLLMVDSERGEHLYGNVVPDLDQAMYSERFPVPLAVLTSERQIGPLPSGGLLGAAGNTFTLSASALYVSFYGRTSSGEDQSSNSTNTVDS